MSRLLMSKPTKKMKRSQKMISILFICFVLFMAVIYVLITKSGHWLVENDEFKHATWAVILDGQSADLERNDFVASLLKEKKVDSVLILGRRVFRDKSNADFYADDFMSLGRFDSSVIFLAYHDDPSTISEAFSIIPWLKKHKADTVLLVTAASATRRVKQLFTALSGKSPIYLTADIKHHHYNPDSWLFNRESRKSWLREWTALANAQFDLINSGELTAKDSFYYAPIRSLKETAELNAEPLIDLQKILPPLDTAKEKSNDSLAVENSLSKVDSLR